MLEEDGDRLPLDIYTVIVEKLEWAADRECLKNLSLASPHLRPLCQRILFRSVTIDLEKTNSDSNIRRGTRRMVEFIELAKKSPVPLANYITDLIFFFDWNDCPAIRETEMAPRFIFNMDNIRSLSLICNSREIASSTQNKTLNWRSLGQPMTSTLVMVIQSPLLQSLELNAINNFPSHILSSLKESRSLEDLWIIYLQIDEETPPNEVFDQHSEPFFPQILKHSDMYFFQPNLSLNLGENTTRRPVLDYTRVTEFSVDWTKQSDIENTKAFIHSAHKIETLHCRMYDGLRLSCNGLADSLLSGSVLTLCTLDFDILPYDSDYMDYYHSILGDPFSGLIQELEKLSTSLDRLQAISINLHCIKPWCQDNPVCDTVYQELETQCKSLDNLFKPGAFPCLRKLVISGKVAMPGWPYYDDYDQDELKNLQGFKKRVKDIKERCFYNISAIPSINFEWDLSEDQTF